MTEGLSWESGKASFGDAKLDEAEKQMLKRAFSAKTRADRVAAARKALEVAPCADAYTLLATEEASSLNQALELSSKALQLAEEQLRAGNNRFEALKGAFGGCPRFLLSS